MIDSEKDLDLRKFVPGTHRLLMVGNVTSGTDGNSSSVSPLLGMFAEETVLQFVNDFVNGPSGVVHKIDPSGLSIMKRKAPTHYRGNTNLSNQLYVPVNLTTVQPRRRQHPRR